MEISGACFQDHTVLQLVCRVHKDAFNLVGREVRIPLEKQSGSATDDAGGHAGTGQLEPLPAMDVVRKEAGQCRTGNVGGDDPVAWSHQIRLHHQVTPGRSTAGVGRNDVVGPVHRVQIVHGADRQDVRTVAWRIDREVVRCDPAVVAGGDDDGNSGGPGPGYGQGHGIGSVRLRNRMAQRQVHDANVVGNLVIDRPFDRFDHCTDPAFAVVVQDLEGDKVNSGSDAADRSVRPGPADGAGDVGSMTEPVVGTGRRTCEVDTGQDPSRLHGGRTVQPGIEEGYGDAGAGQSKVLLYGDSIQAGEGGIHRAEYLSIGGNRKDGRILGQFFNIQAIHFTGQEAATAQGAHPVSRPAPNLCLIGSIG